MPRQPKDSAPGHLFKLPMPTPESAPEFLSFGGRNGHQILNPSDQIVAQLKGFFETLRELVLFNDNIPQYFGKSAFRVAIDLPLLSECLTSESSAGRSTKFCFECIPRT